VCSNWQDLLWASCISAACRHALPRPSHIPPDVSMVYVCVNTSIMSGWTLVLLLQAWRELDQQQWQPCSWQQLDMELSAAARRQRPTQDWQVQLRLPVQHLQQLWALRLQVRLACCQHRVPTDTSMCIAVLKAHARRLTQVTPANHHGDPHHHLLLLLLLCRRLPLLACLFVTTRHPRSCIHLNP
jgi:hypothetical protein